MSAAGGRRLLVTGGGGFVGSAVARALAAAEVEPVRWLVHRRAVPGTACTVTGDLTDPASLRGCCDGVDTVLHLAGRVDGDEAGCVAVNERGTANLLAEAERAGVRDVVYLSHAAVHGRGPHHRLDESAPPAPVSPASRTRRAAEQRVLAAGGVVLRPFFTYGDGDRWFVPLLLRWLRRSPKVWLDHGRAEQSVVAVDDLARVLAAAALDPGAFAGSPLHVCEPRPVAVRDALLALAALFGGPRWRLNVPGAPLRTALRWTGRTRLERRLELLSVEHTYSSERAWAAAGVRPRAAMLERLPAHTGWYARFAGPKAAR
ncbi:NAD-dependent epimerase/dehydratase family protein [Dactylosporangium sp. NPDC051541]|uniref:NAD-dependent epimerase/dehydratase family protein n=1 Tax=Dactylosporangium sp. NPDC051541 TaxID=3363977 RepID=UPI0037BBC0D8